MNVKVPGQDVESLAWFWGIIGFMVFFVVLIISFAHWKRLL